MDSSRDIVRKLRENRILNERTDYESMDRDELIKLAKEGDQFAYKVLIDSHQDYFWRMTKKYVPEGTFDRDDIIQTAEIAFWEAIQKWDMTGDFEAYAGMVIKRRLTDELRKLDTDKAIANRDTVSAESMENVDDLEVQGPEANKSEFDSWISNSHRSAEDEYMDKEFEEEMVKFFKEEMTELERKLLNMYLDGYKMSQIAEETGVKYKTCENAVRRAKNKLKDYFNGVRESRKIREGKDSIFSEEESRFLKRILSEIDESMQESKKMNESALEWEKLSSMGSGDYYASGYGDYTVYIEEMSDEGETYYTITFEEEGVGEIDVELPGEGWYETLEDAKNAVEEYISKNMNESKEVEEHLEVSAGAGSTIAEKVAYVKKMVEKAKEDGDEHSAWDIVDFLYDSMLLDKIPLDESKKVKN